MRFIYFLIIFTNLFSTQIIESNPIGHTSIFIYHSGKALIHENRILDINDSKELELKIIDIPNQIIKSGIQIDANNYQLENFSIVSQFITEETLLKHFVGNRIILQDLKNDKSMDATLISYSNHTAIYGLENGVIVNPNLKPVFPYIPEYLENEIFIKTSGQGKIGKSILKLSYFTDKMNWDTEYHLIINDEDKATLSGDYQIINKTNKNFPSSEIYLVADHNRQDNLKPSKSMYKMERTESINYAEPTPENVSIEDSEIYRIPNSMSIHKNSNLNAKFLQSTSVVLEKKYIINHSSNFYGRSGRMSQENNLSATNLVLKLNSSEKIKIHLPEGKINVYEEKEGINMFITTKYLSKTSKGNNIEFELKSSQDVLHKFNQTEYEETNKGYFLTIVAEFKNIKDKPVTVQWNENSGRKIEIIDSNIEFKKVSAFEYSTNILIDARQSRKATVKLFIPKRDK